MPFDTNNTPALDHVGGVLTQHTLCSLQEFFEQHDHRPSPAMWDAMADLAVHLEWMATGEAESKFFLSSLDPGIGKTMTITHFVSGLLNVPALYGHVGVLICVASLDEVEKLIDAICQRRSKKGPAWRRKKGPPCGWGLSP